MAATVQDKDRGTRWDSHTGTKFFPKALRGQLLQAGLCKSNPLCLILVVAPVGVITQYNTVNFRKPLTILQKSPRSHNKQQEESPQ